MLLWSSGIFLGIWLACHLPALLIFTINHQKKVEQNQPPKGLQFHGGNLELEDMNDSQVNEGDAYFGLPNKCTDPNKCTGLKILLL